MPNPTLRRKIRTQGPVLSIFLALAATAVSVSMWAGEDNALGGLGWAIVAGFWVREAIVPDRPTPSSDTSLPQAETTPTTQGLWPAGRSTR